MRLPSADLATLFEAAVAALEHEPERADDLRIWWWAHRSLAWLLIQGDVRLAERVAANIARLGGPAA